MNAFRPMLVMAAAAGAFALAGAGAPSILNTVQPGQWEVQRSGAAPVRMCVRNVASLAQLEHRGRSCTRVVIRETASAATIHYTCTGAGFGETSLSLVTPRSMRVQTQGIASDTSPFNYKFQARRVGDCPTH